MERSSSRPSQKLVEHGGGTHTAISGPLVSTPTMPRVATRTDPGALCGPVILIELHRRQSNGSAVSGSSITTPDGKCTGGFFANYHALLGMMYAMPVLE